MENNFNIYKKPVKVLKVFADLKFSFSGFLFIKIQTSKKYFEQVKTLHTKLHTLKSSFSMKSDVLKSIKSLFLFKNQLCSCGVTDSTKVFGTFGQGSNPCRSTNLILDW